MNKYCYWTIIFIMIIGIQVFSAVNNNIVFQKDFSATGTNEFILNIKSLGKYSIQAKSKQGTALQLIDRMSGPGTVSGVIGQKDGRLDKILDIGEYKIKVLSAEYGTGKVQVTVYKYVEKNSPQAPLLRKNIKEISGLNDLEQRSYWIKIEKRQTIYLEVQGRNVSDCKLWLNGCWLIDHSISKEISEPVTGQPQLNCKIIHDLNPGYYMLTVYGGPARSWPEENNKQPIYIRFNIPEYTGNTTYNMTMSKFGKDYFIFPKDMNYFLLQLPDFVDGFEKVTLSGKNFTRGNNLKNFYNKSKITKRMREPECSISLNNNNSKKVIAVTGRPGVKYKLFCFHRGLYINSSPGSYWISTVHSGFMKDHADITGFILSNRSVQPVAENALRVNSDNVWHRKFNLLGQTELYFFIEDKDEYTVEISGINAEYRFEPYMRSMPKDYRTPHFKQGKESDFDLLRGYYLFTIKPKHKGIVDITIRNNSILKGISDYFTEETINNIKFNGNFQIPKITLHPYNYYSFKLNDQPDVKSSLIQRRLPLNLNNPLPVVLQPNQIVNIDVQHKEKSIINIKNDNKTPYSLKYRNIEIKNNGEIPAGRINLRLQNKGKKTEIFYVSTYPENKIEDTVPVYLPTNIIEQFPKFSEIYEDEPVFTDFDYKERKSYLLHIRKPGLYQIESTGRLKMNCAIRTRTQVSLFKKYANGIGRNFYNQQYLSKKDYQVTVSTMDNTAGHAGLHFKQKKFMYKGKLEPGNENKSYVKVGEGIYFSLEADTDGYYNIVTQGIEKYFPYRLEDNEGWPILKPGIGSVSIFLKKGSYRYISLPVTVDNTRITKFSRNKSKRKITGRGPHKLNIDEKLYNLWRESPKGQQRKKDIYTFDLTAAADVDISLSNQMKGNIIKVENNEKVKLFGIIKPGIRWSNKLPSGSYRIELENYRKNDYYKYYIYLTTKQLIPGMKRNIYFPGNIKLNLDKDNLVEIYTKGNKDIYGILSDVDNNLIVKSDDSINDWNFRISRKLAAGKYNLEIKGCDNSSKGNTEIFFNTLKEIKLPALVNGGNLEINLNGKVNIIPLVFNKPGSFLRVLFSGQSDFGCIVEKKINDTYKQVTELKGTKIDLQLIIDSNGLYRLKIWSIDHNDEFIKLAVEYRDPWYVKNNKNYHYINENKKIETRIVNGLPSTAIAVEVPAPGTYTFSFNDFDNNRITPVRLLTASRKNLMLSDLNNYSVSTVNKIIWLYLETDKIVNLKFKIKSEKLNCPDTLKKQVYLRKNNYTCIDTESDTVGIKVALISAHTGQPMVSFSGINTTKSYKLSSISYVSSANYIFAHSSISISSVKQRNHKLFYWNGINNVTANDLPADLRIINFTKIKNSNLKNGYNEGKLLSSRAQKLQLPVGKKSIVLTIEKNIGAAVKINGQITEIFYSDEKSERKIFEGDYTELLLFSLHKSTTAYSVKINQISNVSEYNVSYNNIFEKIIQKSGNMTIPLNCNKNNLFLYMNKNIMAGFIVDRKGVFRKLDVGKGYTLIKKTDRKIFCYHKSGLVKFWITDQKNKIAARWGISDKIISRELKKVKHKINPEKSIELDIVNKKQEYYFKLEKSRQLTINLSSKLVCGIRKNDEFIITKEFFQDGKLSCFLTPGEYSVLIRPMKTEKVIGKAALTFYPVSKITDKFGPHTIISDDEIKFFSFTKKEKGFIGIGIQCNEEVLKCELLNNTQQKIFSGNQIYKFLPAGQYFLKVFHSKPYQPVAFTPVVFGIKQPSKKPPVKYISDFLHRYGYLK